MMEVKINLIEGVHLEARCENDHSVKLDGSPSVGGRDLAMRPMEVFLSSLCGCASMDVLMILRKGKNTVDAFEAVATGIRKDAIPAVFESIHLKFTASGSFTPAVLQRAVSLSVEKYCSVRSMLKEEIIITHEACKQP